MRTLENEFRKNGMIYRIKERNESRYFAAIVYPDSMNIVGYETGRIVVSKAMEANMGGVKVQFEESERIIGNESFGKDRYEGCFGRKDDVGCYDLYLKGVEADEKKKIEKGLEMS